MKLLVSVADAEEAVAARDGGADLIDAKDPSSGALGAVSLPTLSEIHAAVAAGPVGRQASAQTDATMMAEILAWSRSRGVYAGISLQGSTLREDGGENKELYGKEMPNRDIVKGSTAVPKAATGFIAALSKY